MATGTARSFIDDSRATEWVCRTWGSGYSGLEKVPAAPGFLPTQSSAAGPCDPVLVSQGMTVR
jgi:hypothetical protein